MKTMTEPDNSSRGDSNSLIGDSQNRLTIQKPAWCLKQNSHPSKPDPGLQKGNDSSQELEALVDVVAYLLDRRRRRLAEGESEEEK